MDEILGWKKPDIEGAETSEDISQRGHEIFKAIEENRSVQEIEELLSGSEHFDAGCCNVYGWTCLCVAASKNRHEVVGLLLEKFQADANAKNKHDGATPLLVAARLGYSETVGVLLSHGADVDLADKKGITPLMIASKKGKLDIVKLLIEEGSVDPCQTDPNSRSALYYACHFGQHATAKFLLGLGVKDVPDSKGITALHGACRQKWEDIVEQLLKQAIAKGDVAAFETEDEWGFLPIHYLVRMNLQFDRDLWEKSLEEAPAQYCLISTLFDLEIEELKKEVKDVSEATFLQRNPEGQLPLQEAIKYGNYHCVDMITGKDTTNSFAMAKGADGFLAIHRALNSTYQSGNIGQTEREAIVKCLLVPRTKWGVEHTVEHETNSLIAKSVHTRDSGDWLPLHLALQDKETSEETIKLLLHHDPDGETTRLTNPNGFYAIHLALEQENASDKIIKMLLDADKTGLSVLKKEPKTGQLPIHLAFDKEVASLSLLEYLIEEDETKESLYARDEKGRIALHCLLELLDKPGENGDPKIADLVGKMLSVTQEKKSLSRNSVSSKLVLEAEGKSGMLPLHMAFKYSAKDEVIDLLLKYDQKKESVLTKDALQRLPLHYACANKNISPKTMQLLLASGSKEYDSVRIDDSLKSGLQEQINAEDAERRLPMHGALEAKLNEESLKTLLIDHYENVDIEEVFESISKRDIYNRTPFHGITDIKTIELMYQYIKKEIPDKVKSGKLQETFKNAILNSLDSEKTIEWLNRKASTRSVVFLLLSDFYVHCVWIYVFMRASRLYLSNLYDGESNEFRLYGLILLIASFYWAVCREFVSFYGRDDRLRYFLDPWNYFELLTVACVIVSAVYFSSDSGSEKPIERLLIATGLLQFSYFVAYLRTTFLPYARFIGGILNIFKELVPFFFVTAIILAAFMNAYFVQKFKDRGTADGDGFDTWGDSFLTIFGYFVGGPDGTASFLDIVFGIVTVVILLNVVIAIVSNAWDDSAEETTRNFWEYKYGVIQEVSSIRKAITDRLENSSFTSESSSPSGEEKKALSWWQYLLLDEEDLSKGNDIFDDIKVWNKAWYFLAYFTLFVLGLVSFGLAWPCRIRFDIFGRNGGTQVEDTTADFSAQAERRIGAIEQSIGDIKQMVGASSDLNTSNIQKANRTLDGKISETREDLNESTTSVQNRIRGIENRMQGLDRKLDQLMNLMAKLAEEKK